MNPLNPADWRGSECRIVPVVDSAGSVRETRTWQRVMGLRGSYGRPARHAQ